MLDEKIKLRLAEKTQDEKLLKLTSVITSALKRSRKEMSKNYAKWDRNIQTYRGIRVRDEDDMRAADANEPEKSIIPLSYAQVQTFVAFGFTLLKQNKFFFEMSATGDEDFDIAELVERGLDRDLSHNEWNSKLYQFLLDMARCSVAPIKHWWTVDTQKVAVEVPMSIDDMGVFDEPQTIELDAISYEGNRLKNISPYRILPDMRLPLTRWKEGQFVADEDEWHITNVKLLEKRGLAAGTEFITPMDNSTYKSLGYERFLSMERGFKSDQDESDFMCIVTEGNIRLVPQEYDLGSSSEQTLYTFRIVNGRLISIAPQGSLHGQFNYDIAQFSPDGEAKLNEGLSDTIHALQETISWLYNSRMTAVRRSLDSHLIVHPAYIDSASLESRSPIIYLTKNAPVGDIRQLVHQLDIRDTTTGHFGDADTLMKTMQFVTGVNENAMGQYAPGRRSATENRAANSGASARMKMLLSCAWDSALGPLGKKMMINQRQGFSFETYQKVFGKSDNVAAKWPLFAPEDPRELVGCEDFLVFDSTLSSEKGFLAQSLQELVVAVISNPEFAMQSGFDMQKAMEEIQTLRGIQNVKRFFKPTQVGPNGVAVGPASPQAIPGQSGLPALSGAAAGGA